MMGQIDGRGPVKHLLQIDEDRTPGLIEAEAEFLGLKTKPEIELARQRVPRIFPTEWNDAVVTGALEPVREAARLGLIKQVPTQELLTVLR